MKPFDPYDKDDNKYANITASILFALFLGFVGWVVFGL